MINFKNIDQLSQNLEQINNLSKEDYFLIEQNNVLKKIKNNLPETIVKDVQINNKSIVKNNIAIVPSFYQIPNTGIPEQDLNDSLRNKINSNNFINKMNKSNPEGTGYFSLNRKPDTPIGDYSFAEGLSTIARGDYSHAEGFNTEAYASGSHAEGSQTKAYGMDSHAEGGNTTAKGAYSHAEGGGDSFSPNYAYGQASHVEGVSTIARGSASHAEGYGTEAYGNYSHAGGEGTTAEGSSVTAIGKYNIEQYPNYSAYKEYESGAIVRFNGKFWKARNKIDPKNHSIDAFYTNEWEQAQNENLILKTAFVIGNGENSLNRSNALTVDWEGNLWCAGELTAISGINVISESGKKFKIIVDDSGMLSTVPIEI